MKEFKIISFDPGITTGFCVAEAFIGDTYSTTSLAVVDAGAIKWENRFSRIPQIFTEYGEGVYRVLIEDFTFRPDKEKEAQKKARESGDYSYYNNIKKTYEVKGFIEGTAFATLSSGKRIVFAPPSEQNASNTEIKAPIIAALGGTKHAISAYLHALNFTYKFVPKPKYEKKAWEID